MAKLLDRTAIDDGLRALDPGWTGTAERLARSIEFGGFLDAVRFVSELAPHCERLDHHPDLDIRWRRVDVVLSTHSAGGVTAKDLELARVVDEVARGVAEGR
ncbi:4a-hydroxytetrahydrobiopterin dehydratase [Jatrophihabitans fulvus]